MDSSSDHDARRVGRRERRRAVQQIASAPGITHADRELRMRSARAAQTRGELAVLMRGLGAAPSTGSVPARPSAPVQTAPMAPAPVSSAPARSTGARIVIGLIVLLLLCGGSVVTFVGGVVDSATRSSSSSATAVPPDLTTAGGWDEMVDALDDEADLDRTVMLAAVRGSATLSVAESDTSSARYLYDGDVTSASAVTRLASEQTFDLSEVRGAVVADVLRRARRSSGAADSTDAAVQVTAGRRGPQLYVTFPDGTVGSYALLAGTDGDTIWEYR